MLAREIKSEFVRLMGQYSIVTIMGPRQSGKTTLVRALYPQKPYVNLEEPDTLARILADPRAFFDRHPDGAILDEIQRAPELLSYLQVIVDNSQTPGMFILTGRHQMDLHAAIAQSLAGRTALLDLLPMTIKELHPVADAMQVDDYLFQGFYPAIYNKSLDPRTHYRNYIRTYVERDVRQLINIKDLNSFQRLMQLLAGRAGSLLNIESLVNDVGSAHNTIKNWLSILEASYLVYRLQPYFENFGKRVIKSPKLYFTDVGLLSYLLGIETVEQLARDKMRGHCFENMVFLELLKTRLNAGQDPQLFYYRDSYGNEVDIIIKYRDLLIPVEVKSTSTFHPSLLKNLDFYQRLAGERSPIGFLVYAGEQEQRIKNMYLINYRNAATIFEIIATLS
jgi:uncharacterized protein